MHRVISLLEALWPSLLIGLISFALFWLFHVRGLEILRWGRRSKQTAKFAKMSEPATRCEVCLQETTMQCSRCKVVKYCSAECQRKHWNKGGHKVECQPKAKGAPHANGHAKKGAQKAKPKSAPEPQSALAKQMLFPYKDFVDMFNWHDLVGEPCGLVNVGNSCYANAVLQCLTYTWPLARYLLSREHSQDCEKAATEFCFLCELEAHVNRALQGAEPIMPQRILARVRNVGASLGYGRQEDAHEFMRFAVDSMQATFLEEAGGEKNIDHVTQETTLVHHIFGGKLQSQVKCMICLAESNSYESVLDLTVEISGSVNSLEGALHTFTSPEWLDGDNKYKCDKCNAYVRGCKRLSIHEGPNVLSIVLKRFQGGHFGKVNKAISFPETLNLTPFISGKSDRPGPYHLYAVIVHVDLLNSTFFGHYLCFVKDASGRWYEADDSDVRPTTLERVLGQKAYMLFYARSEPRAPPLIQTPARANRPSQNGTAPSKTLSKSRASSPSSVLTSKNGPSHSNGDAASNGSVNGPGVKQDAPPAGGANGVTSLSTAGENGLHPDAERAYARGVVVNMLAEADAGGLLTPSERVFTSSETGASAEPAKGVGVLSGFEQDEGGQFADSVILEEPYPPAGNSRGSEIDGESRGGERNSNRQNGNESRRANGSSSQQHGSENGVTGKKGSAENGVNSRRASTDEPKAGSETARGGKGLASAAEAENHTRAPLGNSEQVVEGDGANARARTAAGVRSEHSTAQNERSGSAATKGGKKAAGGLKGHSMESTSAPALVSQTRASREAPVQLMSAFGNADVADPEDQSAVGRSGNGLEGGTPAINGPRAEVEIGSRGADSHRGVKGSAPVSPRGKKRSTDRTVDESTATPEPFEEGPGLLEERGQFSQGSEGVFTQETQLDQLARLLQSRPLEELDSNVWDSVLAAGLPNSTGLSNPTGFSDPPLPDELFLEDEESEALSHPEHLFLPAEKAGLFERFLADGAQYGGVDSSEADAALGKKEETGPFGLGSVPFTPVFTSQPSGKESGRVRHGGSVSGLARGFFGAPKSKRKSDKRPVRTSEVASNVNAPLRNEQPSLGAGFGEGFGVSGFGAGAAVGGEAPFVGEVSDFGAENAHFSDDLTDELVLTTDTSTDEKRNSGGNVKPKGIADLIDNEDLLREVGKSADQRLRSVVKGKVETKAKQGRNDVCNCGSGKKWKKCHGKGVKE